MIVGVCVAPLVYSSVPKIRVQCVGALSRRKIT